MKQLNNYILEKLKLDKNIKVFDELDFSNYKNIVNYIQKLAKEKKLEVKFRNKKMNTGDFCFFIYNKSIKSTYLIGYDGNWDANENSNTSFKSCAKSVINYIENYNI